MPLEVGLCIICGMVHPLKMSCAEAKAGQAKAEQKARDSHARGTVWLNRLVNWRTVILGKLVGDRGMDPSTVMARDLLATLLCLRAEVNALTKLIIDDAQEPGVEGRRFMALLEDEAKFLCGRYEELFPGFKTTDLGLEIDAKLAVKTTEGWPK